MLKRTKPNLRNHANYESVHGCSVLISATRGSRLFTVISSRTQLGILYRRFAEYKHPHSSFATTAPCVLKTHLVTSLTSPHYRLPEEVYLCWKNTSYVCTELFARSLNESGILDNYCILSKKDHLYFGSIGTWEECEDAVQGGQQTHHLKRLFSTCYGHIQQRRTKAISILSNSNTSFKYVLWGDRFVPVHPFSRRAPARNWSGG